MASVSSPWTVNRSGLPTPQQYAVLSKNTSSPNSCICSAANAALSPSNSEHSPIRHLHPPRTVVNIPELHEESKKAKQLEWKLSLQAMIKGLTDSLIEDGTISDETVNIAKCREVFGQNVLPRIEYFEQRIHRIFLRLHKLDGTDCGPDVHQRVKTLATALTSDVRRLDYNAVVELLKSHFIAFRHTCPPRVLEEHARELFHELKNCFYYSNSFEDRVAEFKNDVINVAELLLKAQDHLESDPKSYHKATLAALRSAFTRPAYLLMRCDESNPCIRMLHAVNIAGFAHSETASSYLQMGKAVYDRTSIPHAKSFASLVEATRECAANAGFPEDDPEVSTPSRVRQVVHESLSSWKSGISVFQVFKTAVNLTLAYFYDPYKDYRVYNNIPGVLYQENFSCGVDADVATNVAMRVVRSSSPAQGDQVLPEFKAVLQATENECVNPQGKGTYRYKRIVHVNMQNRFAGPGGQQYSEELQSQGSMRLNFLYPHAYLGFTLSVDPLQNCTTFDLSVKEKVLKNLLSDDTFTLENPTSRDSKYYFPANDRVMWTKALNYTVGRAYDLLNEARIDATLKANLFRDVINLGIVRFAAVFEAGKFADIEEEVQMLLFPNCAVCIDRGMKVNGQMMYLLDPRPLFIAELVNGLGILDKERLPLKKRTLELTSLIHHGELTPLLRAYLADIQDFAAKLLSTKVRSVGISYPGCSDEQLPAEPPPPSPVAARRKLW